MSNKEVMPIIAIFMLFANLNLIIAYLGIVEGRLPSFVTFGALALGIAQYAIVGLLVRKYRKR